MGTAIRGLLAGLLAALLAQGAMAADWPQFRGPNGSGTTSQVDLPLTWSDSKNVAWKTALPGPGSSSPIVWKDRIFVTCYSGYGEGRDAGGNIEDLERHLVAVSLDDGRVLWSRTVEAVMPEDPYSGMGVPEHGYASNTLATDGERVYVFFGKSGVLAFDFDGNQLWQVDVGHESSSRRWGSAASLILHRDTVIVNASEESQSIRALKKATGEEVWKTEASMLELAYNTPVLVNLPNGRTDLVIGVPNEVWGLNPDSGKLTWYAEMHLDGNISPSPIVRGDVVYVYGGYRSNGSLAVRAGGQGNVTESHVLWTSNNTSYIPSPVFAEGKIYWISDQGIAHCAEAASGELVYRERLEGLSGSGRGKPFYASVLLAGDRLYAVSRTGGTFVLAAKDQFEQLANNRFESDTSDFNASAVPCDGGLLLRSNRFLYCVENH